MSSTYSGVFTHTVTIGAETYVEFSMNGGLLTNGLSIDLAEIEAGSTGLVIIQDAFEGVTGVTAGGELAYSSGVFSPVVGSTFDLSALVAAGVTTVNYDVTISGTTGGSTTVLRGILTELDVGEFRDVIQSDPIVVVGPAVKAVVSEFAATFTAGTNILSSVTIPYTQVVEFYDSSDTLGSTFPADDVVPITLAALSGDAGPLPIPLAFQNGVGYGLSGTVDTTSLGSPITFTLTMGQDTGALHLSVDADEYSLAVQEVVVPVDPAAGPTIVLNHLFTPAAGQSYTYSVLGETPGTITATERVVLNVPQAEMNKLLAYSSNWDDGLSGSSGSQPIPDVALLLNTITGSRFDDLTMGLTGATQGTSYAYSTTLGYVQGDESSNCHSLLYQFQTIGGFTYTTPGVTGESDVLASIPEEAIQSFTSTPVTTVSLGGVVGDTVVPGSSGQTAEYAGLSGAIQSLFEQAVNAGLVTSTVKGAVLNDTILTGLTGTPTLETALGTTGSVYGAQWSVGQSLGIYVQFQMQKTRRYQLATLPAFGGSTAAQATTITFGGVTFTVDPLVVETSGSTPVTYEIILNTIA